VVGRAKTWNADGYSRWWRRISLLREECAVIVRIKNRLTFIVSGSDLEKAFVEINESFL